jgi:glyoxylase-like metal-dependent hydrolase (beta-lactamase superfamily II)
VKIPLEDDYTDIIGKAQRGLGLKAVPLPRSDDEMAICKLASVLNLDPDGLVASAKKAWYPQEQRDVPGLVCFNTPYSDMTVNSYLVFDPKTKSAAAFDTGTDCDVMLKFAADNRLTIDLILLTHSHGDHIFDFDRLKAKTRARAFICEREPVAGAETFAPGREFEIGNLRVQTRLTSGHSRGGTTYVVTGLPRRLAIVGDAMFAGSMGGGLVSYEEALCSNREQILSLPDDTILCPGHGPLTTVGEEKRHNPFFASRV